MNRYIILFGYILELPIFLGVLALILVSIATLLIFFVDIKFRIPSFKIRLVIAIGIILMVAITGTAWLYDAKLDLEHIPEPTEYLNSGAEAPVEPSSVNQPNLIKYRYSVSVRLEKLGFVREVYDDGNQTFFSLNSLNLPSIYVEDSSGDLVDQKDNATVQTQPGHTFPIVVVNRLSTSWYLQFNNFIGHIKQQPVFKRSPDNRNVDVYYSDLFYARLPIKKDEFICDQRRPEDAQISIHHSRHFFEYENIRYYTDNCFIDD